MNIFTYCFIHKINELNMLFILVDGAYCVTCGSNRRVNLWNPYKGSLLKSYGGHGDEVIDAQASCDSSQIVSGSLDKSVIVWDVATGTPIRRFRGHAAPVMTVRSEFCFNYLNLSLNKWIQSNLNIFISRFFLFLNIYYI